jgi:hypothetical protein
MNFLIFTMYQMLKHQSNQIKKMRLEGLRACVVDMRIRFTILVGKFERKQLPRRCHKREYHGF